MADNKIPLFDAQGRVLVQPTPEKLRRDAAVLADRIFLQWDREVDVLIVFKARDASECFHAGTFRSKEEYRAVLDALRNKILSGDMHDIGSKIIKRRPI